LPALNAVFVGDALTTYSVTTGRHAPQIAPLKADAAGAPVTRASPVERFRDGAARARRTVDGRARQGNRRDRQTLLSEDKEEG